MSLCLFRFLLTFSFVFSFPNEVHDICFNDFTRICSSEPCTNIEINHFTTDSADDILALTCTTENYDCHNTKIDTYNMYNLNFQCGDCANTTIRSYKKNHNIRFFFFFKKHVCTKYEA